MPGAFDPFEVAVRSVLGQQVTVRGATTLAQRFIEKFGTRMTRDSRSAIAYVFPGSERIANASVSDVRVIGMPEARAKTIVSVARAIEEGRLVLSQSEDPVRAIGAMMDIAGIGNFTSQVVAMRALRHADAFPSSDLGVRKALGSTKPRELEEKSEAWRPWRAYAVVHLWRQQSARA